ncbi:hypothetical protein QLQ12_38915 [Actinoplanes sp. NEAU-A12]|uniref:Uncharacterized protein n=1 Tax=Actinoplanes sandaracinus TaxID=3045177 RepID=A0ABT6WXW5_9ACTN|nr:DUF6653 family protein [Actinoplanes sandaracinus]MDI6104579.1 hypothetical protein [Actinoplanes sandaracinus]
MTTPTAPGANPQKVTGEQRVAKVFGLTGDNWFRHANPISVATRFAVLPLLALSIWSRDWIGWWCLAPVVLSLVFMMINPVLFPRPRSTRNWASRGVFGERVWSERTTVAVPDQFNARVLAVTYAIQLVGAVVLTYGLVRLDAVDTVAGIIILQAAKAWYIDRQVLLFEDMKTRHEPYAAWEY